MHICAACTHAKENTKLQLELIVLFETSLKRKLIGEKDTLAFG